MVENSDIWRSANLLIKQYGDEAAVYAAMQADNCMENEDAAGKATWHRILKAIETLSATQMPDGETRH